MKFLQPRRDNHQQDNLHNSKRPSPTNPVTAVASDRFLQSHHALSYDNQYASLYFYRLTVLKPYANQAAKLKWPGCLLVTELRELQPNQPTIIVGTVYKQMKLKPSALQAYVRDLGIEEERNFGFIHETDSLTLEDNLSRLHLLNHSQAANPIRPHSLVTGLVIAVKGQLRSDGSFLVDDWTLPTIPSQIPQLSSTSTDVEDVCTYVAFVSDLSFGIESCAHQRILLRDFLTSQHPTFHIAALVVVGNTFTNVEEQGTLMAMDSADAFLASIASTVPIHLMPGPDDPIGMALPQPPLPSAYIPRANRYGTVLRCSNPYAFECKGIRFMGSSGQCVDDILQYSDLESTLDALELCMRSRCIAPTAPDTLACFPFHLTDPFSLESEDIFPHVLFSSTKRNQEDTDMVERASLDSCHKRVDQCGVVLSVPSFRQAHQIVLFSLETLSGRVMTFRAV